ncbi:MAG: M12 family metallo-peptidase, partial [Phycisphaerae bacterium]
MSNDRNQCRVHAGYATALHWTLLSIVATVPTYAAPVSNNAQLKSRVNQALRLRASSLVSLQVDRTPGISQQVAVPINGELLVLDVARHSVRSDGYQVRAQVSGGAWVNLEPGPVRTVRGTIVGMGGEVVGAVLDQGLYARVTLPDGGGTYWVEPLMGRVAGAQADLHAVYADGDAMSGGGTCAMAMEQAPLLLGKSIALQEGLPLGCDGLPCEVELACDSDFEFFTVWGNLVEARINLIMNTVNKQYESEVSIVHRITTILIRTDDASDPYESRNADILLEEFRSHWLSNLEDLIVDEQQLFTGKELFGSVVGVAWGLGQVCGTGAFCVVKNQTTFDNATDLSAHELGHLWGAAHCLCNRPAFTMNPSITGANRFEPELTIPDIVAHRETRTCLDSLAPPISFPFMDTFDGVGVDPASWHNIGASVDDRGDVEPSGETSLHLPGTGKVYGGYGDASGLDRLGVQYWWQRTGTTNGSPEEGEDLVLEYKTLEGGWAEADRQLGDPGGGGDDLPYEPACALLPEDADLGRAQIRFRMVGEGLTTVDNFFIDDVRIADGAELLEITVQPAGDCACLGGTAEFNVEAAGIGPFAYQWKLNGDPIPGETADTLVIAAVSAEDIGLYSVEVVNGCGAWIESDVVDLLQNSNPTILVGPQDGEVQMGQPLSLNVVAGGGCNAFQWLFNGVPIPGATDVFLFVQNMQCANQGCYSVVVSNDCGSVTSEDAEIVVNSASCGPFSCVDTAAPVILHGEGLAGQTRPFSGYIDPRRESDNGVDLNQGITEVSILFSEPVQAVGGG